MAIRRATSIIVAAATFGLGLAMAPPAQAAASPSTINVTAGQITPNLSSATVSANIGDTFTIANGQGGGVSAYVYNHTGSVSAGATDCAGRGTCTSIPNAGSTLYTITSYGTIYIDGGASPATLTLQAPSTAEASVSMTVEPPVVAPSAPTVTAVGGDKAVKVTITFGSSGSSPLQYCQVGAVPENSDDVPQPSPLIPVPADASSMDYVLTGLNNGYHYAMTVVCANAQGQWSLAGTAVAYTSAAATCTYFEIRVSQPTGATAAAVTSPITSTTAAQGRVIPNIAPPYGGKVVAPATGAYNQATSTGAPGGEYVTFTVASPDICVVSLSVDDGAKLSPTVGDSVAWDGGVTTMSANTGDTFYAFGTKAGTHTITATAGSRTITPTFQVSTVPAAAYTLALSPSTTSINTGDFGTSTITVTDMFGNTVPGASVTAAASGQVLLGGYNTSIEQTTGAAGTTTLSILAGSTAGQGTVTVTGVAPVTSTTSSDTTVWPWQSAYAKPATLKMAPLVSLSSTVTVVQPETRSITITGERTTVSGKPGIQVTGTTTGLEAGSTVITYYRFPGETTFSQGSARPTIGADGTFSWQRKTGKKFYAYVTSADGSVTSNRVIIPAA